MRDGGGGENKSCMPEEISTTYINAVITDHVHNKTAETL